MLLSRPAIAQTELISVAPGGGPAQGGPSGQNSVAISGDGRIVAFESAAVNLVAGDTNGLVDVFVYDRFTRTTSRVNVATNGAQAVGGASGGSSGIAVSGNGQFVAFSSTATNLVAGDTNGIADVFVHDRATGATSRVSVASDGAQGQGGRRHAAPVAQRGWTLRGVRLRDDQPRARGYELHVRRVRARPRHRPDHPGERGHGRCGVDR